MRSPTDLFLWLSATDRNLLRQAPASDRHTQVLLGMVVLATGILAAVTGGFAVYMTFEHWVPSVFAGVVYGSLILTIDRFIMSATSRGMALIRLPLAAVIGLVIAVPLEMRLFEDRLEQKLQRDTQAYNAELMERLKEEQGLPLLRERIDSLHTYRAEVLKEAREAREAQQEEIVGASGKGRTGVSGKGPAYRNAVKREADAKARTDRLNDRLGHLQKQYDRRREQVMQTFELQAEESAGGLLARFEALGELGSQSPAIWEMAWGLRMLIILIEIAPALFKLLRPVSTYEALQKARRVVNHTRINELANQRVKEIAKDPKNPPVPSFTECFDQTPLST